MNHVYRNIWNEVTRTYVAAAEVVRGRGKRSKSSKTAEGSEAALLSAGLLQDSVQAQAPPVSHKRRITFSGVRPMALEQRFMFDGAAGSEITKTLVQPDTDGGLLHFAASAEKTTDALNVAQQQAEALVADFLQQPDAVQQMFALFHGGQAEPSAEWRSAANALVATAHDGNLSVRVELRSSLELQGAKGAFSAIGTSGQPTIYLNADWLNGVPAWGIAGADRESINKVLVEEIGHYLDAVLNPKGDTAGDEGEIFSRFVVDDTKSLAVSHLVDQNDHITLQIDGQNVQAELASFNFVNAYAMVYDLNNNNAIVGSTGETAAEKEQSSHNFDITGLGAASVNDDTNSNLFSGNDVSAIGINIGGTTYYGWISRPIKSNGIVRGFYFWTDMGATTAGKPAFTDLATAQADGNTDGDSSAIDNKGFLLVVDQAWFTEKINSQKTTVTLNNNFDGVNRGVVTYSTVGSSSDRVDSALNSLLVPNSAPTPGNDSLTVNEDSGTTTVTATNGLLKNDSDVNNDSLTVTSFSVGGVSTAVGSSGGTYAINNVGSVTIYQNGSYVFNPATNYNGPVPPITYTVSDSKGGTATAVLSISVTPVNDPPVSTNDTLTVNPNTAVFLSLSDFGSYSDPDNNPLAKISITALPTNGTGTLEYLDSTWKAVTAGMEFTAAAINAGQLRLTTATADTSIGFKVSDGTATSVNAYTLSIAIPAGPSASADTGTGTDYEATEIGSKADGSVLTSGSVASGSVLTNDSGSGIKVTSVFNTAVAASGNTSIQGQYGTLSIAANGSYTYTPDTTFNSVVDQLNVGNSKTETFSYTIIDSNGKTSTSTLTVKVNGANDAPVARDDANSLKELATITNGNYGTVSSNVSTGVLGNDSDVDNPSSSLKVVLDGTTPPSPTSTTFSASSPISSVTVATTEVGSYDQPSSVLPNKDIDAAPFLISFDSGTTWTTAKASDGTNLKIYYLANGSKYIFSDNVALYSYKDAQFSYTNSNGKEARWTVTLTNPITSSGDKIYTTSSSITSIQVGDTATWTVNSTTYSAKVTAIDSKKGEITLDDDNNASTAYSVSLANLSLTFTKPSISLSATQTYKAGTYGYLILNQDGGYTYTLTSNELNAGDTRTESFTYTTTDGSTQSTATLRIRIDGTSTTYISAGNDSLTVNEDTAGTIANILNNDSALTTVIAYSWGDQSTTTPGTELSLTSIGKIRITSLGALTFTPAANYNGPVPYITYTIANGAERASAIVSLSITPVNDAPTSTDDAITTLKNTSIALKVGDFGTFSDVDGDALAKVKITTLPGKGTLTLNGNAVTTSTEITKADLEAGNLVYTPLTDEFGSSYTTLKFQVSDGAVYSSSDNTLTINVTSPTGSSPVNTLPTPPTLANYETKAWTTGNFSVSDADGDITSTTLMVANGTLSITGGGGSGNGTASNPLVLTGNKTAIDALLAKLVYSPSADFSGTDTLRMYTVDAAGNSDTDFLDITVTADNRTLSVSGTTVNEASPYVLFQVTGNTGQHVSLQLAETNAANGNATLSIDFLPNLEYFDGGQWVAYAGGTVAMPAATLLVRTAVLQDTLNEGAETLKLIAKNSAGTAAEGISTIKDDGTGSVYLEANKTFTADTSGTGYPTHLDDDRPITVNNISINEASPYAVFTVNGQSGQVVRLVMSSGTATFGTDTASTFQVNNGVGWVDYTPGSDLTLAGSTLLVRTAVTQDNTFEGQEAFTLAVTKQSSGKTVYGIGNIYDDGTGDVYLESNTSGTKDTSGTGYPAALDDDRTIAIDSPTVNEASNVAIFTLTGNSGQTVSLQLFNDSSNGTVAGKANVNASQTLQIWDGLQWVNYDASNLPTFDANNKIFVSVNIQDEHDTPYEGSETFRLKATLTGSTKTAEGTGTIVDDGTGKKYDGTFTNSAPTEITNGLDDDRSAPSDTTPPTVAISSDKASLKAGESATLTFSFSEDVGTSFDASDITVSGGTLGTLTQVSATVYTATFTPTTASTTDGVVSVASNKFTDLAGNANTDGADANNTSTLTVDTVRPTVAISSDKASLKAGESATLTFTFSEDVGTSFDASDITVSGGTLGTLTQVSATVYTATFTPTTASTTDGVVSVASNKFTDLAGNANTDGAEANNSATIIRLNNAPVGADNTVTVLEDGDYTLLVTDFGFSDTTDSHTLAAVKINSLPAKGELRYNGVAITAQQVTDGYEVSVADLVANKLTFVPVANDNGAGYTSFTFQVRDNGGTANGGLDLDQSPNAITVDVTAVNDVPLAQANTYNATEDTLLTDKNILTDTDATAGTDSDVEGSTLSVAKVNGNDFSANGTDASHLAANGWMQVALTNGTLFIKADGTTAYQPAANSTAGDSFTYTVGDGTDESASATVTFNVTVVDDSFSDGDETVSTAEDTAKSGNVLANASPATTGDGAVVVSGFTVAGDTTLYSAGQSATLSGVGTVTIATNGDYTFTPLANYNGAVPVITYTLSDGVGATDTSTLNLSVTEVNDAPVALADTASTTANVALTVDSSNGVLSNDTDADASESHTVSVVNGIASNVGQRVIGSAGGTFTVAQDGSYSFDPGSDFRDLGQGQSRDTSVSYTNQDTGGLNSQANLTVTVVGVNDMPVASDTTISTAFNVVKSGSLPVASDPDGDNVSYAIGETVPSHGTVVIQTDGAYTYTPASGYTGVDNFSYTVTDGQGGSNTYTVSVTVEPLQQLTIDNPTVNEASPYVVFRVSGVQGQQMNLSLVQLEGATGIAQLGTDTGTQLQYFNGDMWKDYTGSLVTYPVGSTTLLVRTTIVNDTNDEGSETFQLKVVTTDNLTAYGKAVIGDDGRGSIFNESGAENPNAAKDDDRSLKVSSFSVNEGSPYAVFQVTGGAAGDLVSLTLKPVTPALTDATPLYPVIPGADYVDQLEYYTGVEWKPYTAGEQVALLNGGLYVRVAIINDDTREPAESFQLEVTDGSNDATKVSVGVATVQSDGLGQVWLGNNTQPSTPAELVAANFTLDDDFDLDGIAPNVEEILATMSSSTGNGGQNGDLNADGVQDAEQPAVATLAWIKADYFTQALSGTLTEVKPIISVLVNATTSAESTASAGDAQYQLSKVEVIPQADATVGGMPVTVDQSGATITAPWDPIQFTITPTQPGISGAGDADGHLDDADLSRMGTQVTVTIDIARSGMKEGDFNAYLKYVSAAVVQSAADKGIALKDLDGKTITEAGWYDFTQRQDASGNYVGDGARFIIKDGKIVSIQLTLTDNAFGDNDMTADRVLDPGMPVSRIEPVKVAITAHTLPQPIELKASEIIEPKVDFADEGIRFQYPPFDSTLYTLQSQSSPQDSRYIEPSAWHWTSQFESFVGQQSIEHDSDILHAWRVLSVPTEQASLQVLRGMGDQFAEWSGQGRFVVPTDAFVHTLQGAEVQLHAALDTGDALPSWLVFNARTGTFTFQAPDHFRGELKIKLTARDGAGREASTLFRFHVAEQRNAMVGRAGLSEQLRAASQHRAGQRPLEQLFNPATLRNGSVRAVNASRG